MCCEILIVEVTLEVGSLYRYLSGLGDEGLIVQVDPRPAEGTDPRRKDYDLTPLGRDVLRAEAERLRAVVRSREVRGILRELPG